VDNRVLFLDTTLREGEQFPGVSLSSNEKLEIAWALKHLGVDIIEAGLPSASPDDLEAVRRIAEEVGNSEPPTTEEVDHHKAVPPIICALARAEREDIDAAWEAVKAARRPRIHVFLATSPMYMQYKLNATPEEVAGRVQERVAYARSLCDDVEFSPEDALRSEPDFLRKVISLAIQAGASTINIPDSVGYATPGEYDEVISGILKNVSGIEQVTVSVHCHNDLGLATANSLAGLIAGARQVEGTILGIGERAGNTPLEEVAIALHTRRSLFGLHTEIDVTQISRVSHIVAAYTGFAVPPYKALAGANALAHESSPQQAGSFNRFATYEIMRPEAAGSAQTSLVLGKHSGKHALQTRLRELGHELTAEELDRAFERFKELADKKKTIANADLDAMVADQIYQPQSLYALDGLQVSCGTTSMPTATVRIRCPDGSIQVQAAVGAGPVDAAYKAIDAVVRAPNTLQEFAIHAITAGIDAIGEVTVRLTPDATTVGQNKGRVFGGHGADIDIIVASAKAYLSALNKMVVAAAVKAEK
jgi:2-isopropylmalate synthase